MSDADRFQDFAQMGADWFWETDREDRFTHFSVGTSQQGFDLGLRIGRTRHDLALSDPDNLILVERIQEIVRARQPFRNMAYRITIGGEPPHWCEISGDPKYDGNGAFVGYRGVGRDITPLVETRQALEIKGRALEAILRAMPDGVQVIDKTGATLAVNDQIYELLDIPNRKSQPDADSNLQSMVDLAKRGEYGPGDPETLAKERTEAMLNLLAAEQSVTYQRQLKTGRWFEARLRAIEGGGMLSLYRDITEDKQRQAELERQSTLLSTIVSNVNGGLSVIDADGRVSVWNEGFAELVGIEPALVRTGASVRDLLLSQAKAGEFGPCDPEAEADRRLKAFHTGRRVVSERTRPNGRIIELRRSPTPGGGSVTIYLDITERRRIERELQELNATLERRIAERTAELAESERFQRTLISNVPGMVYRSKKRDGHWAMEFASEGCRNLFGVSTDDLVSGRVHARDLVHPGDRKAVWSKARADLKAGHTFELEYRVRHADGTWRWVWDRANVIRSESGEVVALEGLVLNIDARKTAEQELARTRDHLIDALDSLDQNMILYDRDDRLVMLTNHVYDQFAPAVEHFVVGKTFEEVIRHAIETAAISVPSGMTKEQFTADRVAHHKRADGAITVRHLPDGRVLHISERRSPSGGIVSVGRDVTEQLKMERQLREAQRMEAIGQLTGGLAHDLNNYLAVIMGNLDMLAECKHADPTAPDLIEGALAGARRGAELTRSLLAFSRRQPLDPKVIDLGQRISEIAQLLKRTIGERITLELQVAPGLWPVKIDGAQLDSAIVNLANNARDAMPNGGTLTIAARNCPPDMPDAPVGDHVLIEVTDSGAGMDEITLAQAFEPFFSTKGPGHGTGLGLSMVHGFVHQSGGVIRLASKVGQGTAVRLFLPRTPERPAVQPERTSGGLPRGTENIVLVDDNDDVRQAVAEQLKSLGYGVTETVSGDAALTLLEGRAGEFDLVLSDLIMPGKIDGLALAKIVRDRWPKLPVLLTTGFAGEINDTEDGTGAGFNVLSKPYRKADLAHTLRVTLKK